MIRADFAALHDKLNTLLEDHGVTDFDESNLDLNSVSSLHAKTNALCVAHGGDPSGLPSETIEELHPKLDQLLDGHKVEYEGMDTATVEAADAKIEAILHAHHHHDD